MRSPTRVEFAFPLVSVCKRARNVTRKIGASLSDDASGVDQRTQE